MNHMNFRTLRILRPDAGTMSTTSTGDDKVRYIFMGVALVFAIFSFFVIVLMCYLSCRHRRDLRRIQEAEASDVHRAIAEANEAIRDPETGEIDISFYPDAPFAEQRELRVTRHNQAPRGSASHRSRFVTFWGDHPSHDSGGVGGGVRPATHQPGRLERLHSSGVSLSEIDQACPAFSYSMASADKSNGCKSRSQDSRHADDDFFASDCSCPICLEPYSTRDALRRLECDHVFHSDCIVRWLSRVNRCPLCNTVPIPIKL